MPLGLLEGSHDAKRAEQVSLGIRGNAWDDGVIWPLPGSQAVGVLGIQEEVVAPIVQREATPLWDDACDEFTTLPDGTPIAVDYTRSGRFGGPFLGARDLRCLAPSVLILITKLQLFCSQHAADLSSNNMAPLTGAAIAVMGSAFLLQAIQRHTGTTRPWQQSGAHQASPVPKPM